MMLSCALTIYASLLCAAMYYEMFYFYFKVVEIFIKFGIIAMRVKYIKMKKRRKLIEKRRERRNEYQ